eukprot:Plantae.Rhodophyta-Hildenbrandia_rubra.ctg41214.p1 GENE.Plantae.Rhodophyta-Hildenbrandia_rubra.ctg41214~~Plantae.Rhodophyta-Hildenbrandia_rubra.ctg41214.p1  ORF type:complete len:440 (-),score=120.49 Plantae.Rhodophyta-Hildenbrandia_rubra.ctg41214:235-1554(-)
MLSTLLRRVSPGVSSRFQQPHRHLSLHEYQSQDLMRKAGIPVPRGLAVSNKSEAEKAALQLYPSDIVVKAQILAGGRGRGTFKNGFRGGVHVCYDKDDAIDKAKRMLGNTLVTKQTGESGKVVGKVLMAERVYVRREMYLALVNDGDSGGAVFIASKVGGMSIEDVAKEDPEAVVKVVVGQEGLDGKKGEEVVKKVGKALGFEGEGLDNVEGVVKGLYGLFMERDATLVEVNPLVETKEGKVMCVDAKIKFDDNAEFRQKEIFDMRDTSQEDPRELKADKVGLNYIGLDGNIGCMVNGAGLAMATMDIIKNHGGEPANFLDVGGSATEEQVTQAFKILNDDKQVEAILVNIFGGIMRCDVIAQGIISAAQKLDLRVPLVVRLQGNMVEEAKELLRKSELRIIAADDLDEAAKKACKLAEIVKLASSVDVDVKFQTSTTI